MAILSQKEQPHNHPRKGALSPLERPNIKPPNPIPSPITAPASNFISISFFACSVMIFYLRQVLLPQHDFEGIEHTGQLPIFHWVLAYP